MAERDLVVRFIGDDRQLQQAFTRSERRAGQFDSRMTKLNQGLRGGLTGLNRSSALLFGSGTFLSAAALTAALEKSVSAASDLNEQLSKSRQVFGDSSRDIERWSKETASSFGISERAALAATGTFGNLFSVVELAPARAAEMSRALVELAADLASFNNASPEDVLTALRSGLIGEAEPLRRFGVLLSEARVQQVALDETGKENVKTLTDQEKALARFAIIMQDTAKAQGDFARTSGGLANQSRILRAEVDDLSASFGTALLPTVTRLAMAANDAIDGINAVGGAIGSLADSDFEAANARFEELIGRFQELNSFTVDAPAIGTELDDLGPRIREIGLELNRLGSQNRVVAAFREASREIDQALEDGVITPLEKAQLEADELGRLFLTIVPPNVLEGLGAEVRSGLEDATATARTGVADLGAEIRSGIEDASRQAALAAREGGEQVGDSFVEGLQAASGRIQGQIAGLSEQVIRAQIRGDEQAELTALQEQKTRLQNLLRKQEQIVAAGGPGAASARERIRKNILPQLLAVTNAIEGILEDREAAMRDLERDAEAQKNRDRDRIKKIADNRREAAELARAARQGDQFEALGLTSEGDERVPGVGSLRKRLRSLREQVRGTTLDTEQTQNTLDRIAKVLAGKFGKVGRDVRAAILAMFNEIASGFDEGGKKVGADRGAGEITRGGIRSTQALLRGLDLTDEERRIIQQRNLGVTGRRGLAAFGHAIGTPSFGVGAGATTGGAFVIQNLTVVTNDPNDMLKKLQKKARRSAGGRRGRHGGANLGAQ